jgi:hypothetical protein
LTVRVVTAVLPVVDLSYHRYAVVGGHITVVIGGGSLCEVTFTSHKTSVPTLQLRLPVIVLDQSMKLVATETAVPVYKSTLTEVFTP